MKSGFRSSSLKRRHFRISFFGSNNSLRCPPWLLESLSCGYSSSDGFEEGKLVVGVVVMAIIRIREAANKDRRLGRRVHGRKALFKYFSGPRPTFRERVLNVIVLTFEHHRLNGEEM